MSGERLLVGRVRGPHGTRGAVKVEVITDRPQERFSQGAKLFVSQTPLTITESSRTKDGYLLRFTEVGDRTSAEELRGAELSVSRESVDTDPDEFLHGDLIGLTVYTVTGEELGKVIDIFNTGANDIYEVQAGERKVLIPAIEEVITEIDIESGKIVVNPIEGLLE